jgi:hypothetical protein
VEQPGDYLASEREASAQLEEAAGNGGAGDLAYARVRNTRGERRRCQSGVGLAKTWMVDYVGGVHTDLQAATFEFGYTERLC